MAADGEDDGYPIPDDPALAQFAEAFGRAGLWFELVDPRWRLVYVSEDLRLAQGFMIERMPVMAGVGYFSADAMTQHEHAPGGDGVLEVMASTFGAVGGWTIETCKLTAN